MQKTIVSFGETLWDLFPSGPALGGAPFNLAYRLHSLGDRSVIVTRIGADEPGRQTVEQMAAWGMEASGVQRDDPHPTGTVKITVDDRGNPDFFIVPDAAYDFINVTPELLVLAAAADCFCFGTVAQRTQESRLTLYRLLDAAGKAVKLLDINLRKDCFFRETITESLTRADVLKLNLPEAHYLAELFEISLSSLPDFCAEMIEEWSLACCLVTLGEHGALAASAKGEQVYVPGYQVNVVDTCGSGDAFAAGFIHEYLGGKSLADCVRLGNALGTMIAMTRGATNPVSIEEVRHFLKAKHARFHEPSLQPFDVG